MTKVDLVFRQIDERTRDLALELAIEHIRPDRVHVMDDVRPFSECVARMLRIDHDCDYVVYVDADCLILEDMRGFIDTCDVAYVDSYVSDRFRGRIHCGVHVTRIDLVRAMAAVRIPENDEKYVLRPESRLRNLALKPMGLSKQFRNFEILHDYFQSFEHIFMKYALRELRSRVALQRARLNRAMARWVIDPDQFCDLTMARHAVDYARAHVPADATPAQIQTVIETLPEIARSEVARLGVEKAGSFDRHDLEAWLGEHSSRVRYGNRASQQKIFGLGLSRTGTRSLTTALQVLGFDTSHYPVDEDTWIELSNAQYDLSLLRDHDGITDITTIPFYPQLDEQYPGSKFILTVRDLDGWLGSCARHYFNRPAFMNVDDPDEETRMHMRQFLRAAVYGCYNFAPQRFRFVYEQHVRQVLEYFKDRPDDLLVLNICEGEGYERLAPFLGRPLPSSPFPHKGAVLSQRMLAEQAEQAERAAAAAGIEDA